MNNRRLRISLRIIALTLFAVIALQLIPTWFIEAYAAEQVSDATANVLSNEAFSPNPAFETNEDDSLVVTEQDANNAAVSSGIINRDTQPFLATLNDGELRASAYKGYVSSDLSSANENLDKQYTKADVESEINNERQDDTKVYRMKDGNKVAVVYSEPVHYYKSGEWVELKHELVLNENTGRMETEQAPYEISFSKTLSGDNLATYKDARGEISLTPISTRVGIREQLNRRSIIQNKYNYSETLVSIGENTQISELEERDQQRVSDIKKKTGTAYYTNVFDKAHLEYIVKPYSIKENIIVTEPSSEYSYGFKLNTGKYVARKSAKNRIEIYAVNDNENVLYEITAPYMTDAAGVTSQDIELQLGSRSKHNGDNIYILTVLPSITWMQDTNRTFPVTIDPTMGGGGAVTQSSKYEAVTQSETLGGRVDGFYLGTDTMTCIRLLSLPNIQGNYRIVDARINMAKYLALPNDASKIYVTTAPHYEDWNYNNVLNGTNYLPLASLVVDSIVIGSSDIVDYLNIMTSVKDSYNNKNYGFRITCSSDASYERNTKMDGYFNIEITYVNQDGLRSEWSTHTASVSEHSGTAYVKDFTGDMVYVHPDLSQNTLLTPASVDHVFNKGNIGGIEDDFYGNGWRLSAVEKIDYDVRFDVNGNAMTVYIHTDGTGAKHYLYYDSSRMTYVSEEDPTITYNTTTRIMSYTGGIERRFNSNGDLTGIYDTKREVSQRLSYNSEGKLTSIYNQNSGSLYFIYYSDTASSGSAGKLKEIYDICNTVQKVAYSYNYNKYSKTDVNGGISHYNEASQVNTLSYNMSSLPKFTYTYYTTGNIRTIRENGVLVQYYEYDAQGQLVREDNKHLNNGSGYTIRYVYDLRGNMTHKYTHVYSNGVSTSTLATGSYIKVDTYGYDNVNLDMMTSINGVSIARDNIGNPTTYSEKASRMDWEQGRVLASITPERVGNASVDPYLIQFQYNADGFRTLKRIFLAVPYHTYYFLEGDRLISERNQRNNHEIMYHYDATNNLVGFSYLNISSGISTYYRYVKNLQGDVIGLLQGNTIVARYTYDTWGKILSVTDGNGNAITNSSHIAHLNPIRYRGYYYDVESGLYYVSSRYYDPETCRFINADSQLNAKDGLLGYNLFTYCNNNPVMYSDPDGHSIVLACIIGGAIIGALAGGHVAAKVSKAKTGKVNGWAIAGGIIGGGIVGGLIGWGIGAAATAIGAAATGTAATTAAPVVEKVVEKTSTAIQTYYPPNNGFSGAVEKITLDVGTIIQRTGDFAGRFTAPAGTPSQMLSLPYDKIGQATTYFQTTQPIQALSGTVAPWFGQIGGGTQYLLLNGSVDQLFAQGVLKIFGG